MKLRKDESQIAQCALQGAFTATLTNFRLIIESSISEESYPLAGITGVAVIDDIEGFKKKTSEIKQKKAQPIIAGAFIGLVLSLIMIFAILQPTDSVLMFLTVIIGIAAGIFVGYQISKKRFQKVELESFLEIMQSGGAKRFSFIKTDNNARAIKDLVNSITDTMK
ncbi:MAG: hypothetical protein M0Q51_01290 [Bacteroidales bacterium]|nr:hypothetical protein [Bacteroidales bacterium]